MITGGSNMYNNAESVVFDGEVFRPPSNYVNLDTHNGYEVSSGRYVIQIVDFIIYLWNHGSSHLTLFI